MLSNFERFKVDVSSVTLAELSSSAEKCSSPEQNREALSRFMLTLEVVAF